MTKLSNTKKLTSAVNATIAALIDNDHTDHAGIVGNSIANSLQSSAPVTIDTLHQWLELLDVAHRLISDSGDECTADETADLASSYVREEIPDIEFAAGAALTNYDQLHGRLNDAYAILADLPQLANSVLNARVRHVVEMLDELTFDTVDRHQLTLAGIEPDSVVEAALLRHIKMDSTVRYLGVELGDALVIAEAIES